MTSMTSIRINVTQDHIDAADYLKENEPCLFPLYECCPVALALKTQGFPDATAGCQGWIFDGEKGHCISTLFDRTRTWDHHQTMEPFSFEMKL